MNADQVRALLLLKTKEAGSGAAWARQHGVSRMYVSLVLGGKALPGEAILRGLGLQKIVGYAPIRKSRTTDVC